MEQNTTEWTEEDWQNLKLSDNFLFGYVMQDAEMARIFLESLLDIEIESVSHVKTQDEVELAPQLRGVRLDVRLKADGQVINVEMQTTSDKNLPRRIRYYQALGDSQLLLRHASFSALPEFLTIFVCTFDPLKKRGARDEDGLPLYTIQHTVREDSALKYDDGRRIMLFNTAAWKKSLAKNQRDMLKYIHDGGGNFDNRKVSGFANKVACFKIDNRFRRNYMNLNLTIMESEWKGYDKGYEAAKSDAQAEIAERDTRIAERDTRIAESQARIAELEARLAKYETV